MWIIELEGFANYENSGGLLKHCPSNPQTSLISNLHISSLRDPPSASLARSYCRFLRCPNGIWSSSIMTWPLTWPPAKLMICVRFVVSKSMNTCWRTSPLWVQTCAPIFTQIKTQRPPPQDWKSLRNHRVVRSWDHARGGLWRDGIIGGCWCFNVVHVPFTNHQIFCAVVLLLDDPVAMPPYATSSL